MLVIINYLTIIHKKRYLTKIMLFNEQLFYLLMITNNYKKIDNKKMIILHEQ